MEVRQLFISPGHNFVGHHGEPPGDHPTVAVEQIECVAGRGIRGDRFFDHRPDFKGQITFFAMEVVEALAYELGLAGVRPELTRRNVFTRGADLTTLIGVEFEVQGVRFAGTEECRPCYWMDQAFGDERIEAWLQGRGGLRARILTDGFLTAKDGGLERHGRLHRARRGDPDRRMERLAGRDLRSAAAAASQGRARFDLTGGRER